MPDLSHALVPAQESKRWSFGRLLLLPVTQKAYFRARKSQEKLGTQIRASQFKIPATDAVCVKVASSLTFCARSSLQSFSTSDKMKGPKTGPPGGTTFDVVICDGAPTRQHSPILRYSATPCYVLIQVPM